MCAFSLYKPLRCTHYKVKDNGNDNTFNALFYICVLVILLVILTAAKMQKHLRSLIVPDDRL